MPEAPKTMKNLMFSDVFLKLSFSREMSSKLSRTAPRGPKRCPHEPQKLTLTSQVDPDAATFADLTTHVDPDRATLAALTTHADPVKDTLADLTAHDTLSKPIFGVQDNFYATPKLRKR